ncbi:MAG: B12-binding domain-containing radical SAM protein [Deltaproteobacteria bacterium]|nr:B12-binding domain-containing radical SAM protein [Deltaproteobacteria bacterium]
MKILFYFENTESLGIEYLSAFLKRHGHETDLIFHPKFGDNPYFRMPLIDSVIGVDDRALIEKAKRFNPDLLAFSTNITIHSSARKMARMLKESLGVPAVVGGHAVEAMPEIVAEDPVFDYVILGEGEDALLELVEALEKGRDPSDIRNLWFRKNGSIVKNPLRPLVSDLDTLPFPDRDIFARNGGLHGFITGSRGCPFKCSFCASCIMWDSYKGKGSWYRVRSPEKVVDECVVLKEKYGFDFIHFYDDTFPLKMKWLDVFCADYKKRIGLPFDIILQPIYAKSQQIKMLADAGCVQVNIGIQSGDARVSKELLNRPEEQGHIREAVRIVKEVGIKINSDIMLGFPDETREEIWNTVKFMRELKPDTIHTAFFFPLPGTPLAKYTEERGYVKKGWEKEISDDRFSFNFTGVFNHPEKVLIRNLKALLPLFALLPDRAWDMLPLLTKNRVEPLFQVLYMASLPFLDPPAFDTYWERFTGSVFKRFK